MTRSNPSLELVEVIGDVGGEVGALSIGPDQDPVLLVAVGRRVEPQRPVVFVGFAALAQDLEHARDGPRGYEVPLGEPAVEHHPETGEVVADPAQDPFENGVGDERVVAFPESGAGPCDEGVEKRVVAFGERGPGEVAPQPGVMLTGELPRDVADVLTPVATARKSRAHRPLDRVQVAQPDAEGQDIHLAARVVDVVLALDVPTHRLQQVRHRGTAGRAAAVSDVERTGRVDRHELHLHPLAGEASRPAPRGVRVDDVGRDALKGAFGHREVDEAGAGHRR